MRIIYYFEEKYLFYTLNCKFKLKYTVFEKQWPKLRIWTHNLSWFCLMFQDYMNLWKIKTILESFLCFFWLSVFLPNDVIISGDISSYQSSDWRISVVQLYDSRPRPDSAPSLQLSDRFRCLSQRRRNRERGKESFINDITYRNKIWFFPFLRPDLSKIID